MTSKYKAERDYFVGKCLPYTMTQAPRMQVLWNLIECIEKYKLRSSFVEAGVYKGGSAMLMAYALKTLKMDNQIILFDTFAGMTKPTERDVKIAKGNLYFDKWLGLQKIEESSYGRKEAYTDWCYAPLEDVIDNMMKTKYENIQYVKGDVVETIPELTSSMWDAKKISLLRLDTDFYESTKHLMENFFPRVEDGGFVVFDDYNCWKGAKDAVDEYFAANGLNKHDIVTVDHSCSVYQVGGKRCTLQG